MSKGWSGGSTRQWRRVRALVLTRDAAAGWGCRAHEDGWCDPPGVDPHTCTGRPTHAHHTRGKRHGDDPQHIVASCGPCNLAIGEPDPAPVDPPAVPVTPWR